MNLLAVRFDSMKVVCSECGLPRLPSEFPVQKTPSGHINLKNPCHPCLNRRMKAHKKRFTTI
jgi:hypothetical protein